MDTGKRAIGPDALARPGPGRDAPKWVKDTLRHLGRYQDGPHPHGYIDRELDEAISAYQRDCGLRCDGWLRPGGETENTLRVELIRLGKE